MEQDTKNLLTAESTHFESFDGLSTSERFDDASFTLFKSTFLSVTEKRLEGRKDYLSFGMIDQNDNLTYAGLYRIEYIDYPENAVREALVNALVHRDYNIIGSEIHIDIYDDRLEIVSPGGMFDGKNIQEVDINKIASIRRNPILADIFSRLDYMERRGSGLKRTKDSFINKNNVEFYSNESSFFVIMRKQHQDRK